MVWQWCMRLVAVLMVAVPAWAEPFTYELSTLNQAGTGYDLWEGGFTFEGNAGDPFPSIQDVSSVSLTSPYSGTTYRFLPTVGASATNLERLDHSAGRLGDPVLTGATASDPRDFWVIWDIPDLDTARLNLVGLVAWNEGTRGAMQYFESGASVPFRLVETTHDAAVEVINPAWKLELVGGSPGPQPVPEPGTLALIAVTLALWFRIVR